jgi:hypothetical protein
MYRVIIQVLTNRTELESLHNTCFHRVDQRRGLRLANGTRGRDVRDGRYRPNPRDLLVSTMRSRKSKYSNTVHDFPFDIANLNVNSHQCVDTNLEIAKYDRPD